MLLTFAPNDFKADAGQTLAKMSKSLCQNDIRSIGLYLDGEKLMIYPVLLKFVCEIG